MDDSVAIAYCKTWVSSAQKCRPTQDWHWDIMQRDYQLEFEAVRSAFIGRIIGRSPLSERGQTWNGIEWGARKIAAAIADRFAEHSKPLPYVNTLWLVSVNG